MRLIDADALKKYYIEKLEFFPALVKNAIDRQPTIDPVKHGKWIWHDNEEDGDLTGMWGYHECSNCHFGIIDRLPYCGHCGAKMDGE